MKNFQRLKKIFPKFSEGEFSEVFPESSKGDFSEVFPESSE